ARRTAACRASRLSFSAQPAEAREAVQRPRADVLGAGVTDVRDLIRRDVDAAEHDEIRELWKKHSIAEDARDLPGLISTLTEDCVYELVESGHRWEGHEGATRFYMGLLSAFPDITFDLTDIVIGPQGVCEEADVTGTHLGEW